MKRIIIPQTNGEISCIIYIYTVQTYILRSRHVLRYCAFLYMDLWFNGVKKSSLQSPTDCFGTLVSPHFTPPVIFCARYGLGANGSTSQKSSMEPNGPKKNWSTQGSPPKNVIVLKKFPEEKKLCGYPPLSVQTTC